MIISHRHRYVFIELPLTASTAIANELVENYDGQQILDKHSMYHDFLREMGEEGRSYFVFAGVRNPMDQVVSEFLKVRSDHNQNYSNPRRKGEGRLRAALHSLSNRRKFRLLARDASFEDFFLALYMLPYCDWSVVAHKSFNHVVRFERLQEDFAQVLQILGLEQVRPLPRRNPTRDKAGFESLYISPVARRRARFVFGPFMSYWNYEFPAEWGPTSPPGMVSRVLYHLANVPRRIYWRWLRR